MAVTPVRTGPLPTSSLPSPEMSVLWPTSTPRTSVMALLGPGVPSKGTPRSRARGLVWADRVAAKATIRMNVVRRTGAGMGASDELQQTGKYKGCESDESELGAVQAVRRWGTIANNQIGLGGRLWTGGRRRWW